MGKDIDEIMDDGIKKKNKTVKESINKIIFMREDKIEKDDKSIHINYSIKVLFSDPFDRSYRQKIIRNILDNKIILQFLNNEDIALRKYLKKGNTINNMIKNMTRVFCIKYKHLQRDNITFAYIETY